MDYIPVIRFSEQKHDSLMEELQWLLATAGSWTVFSGDTLYRDRQKAIDHLKTLPNVPLITSPHWPRRKGFYHPNALRHPVKRVQHSVMYAGMRATATSTAPSARHLLVHHLDITGRLLRCYTQDIHHAYEYNSEAAHGRIVQLHGSNMRLRCSRCREVPTGAGLQFNAAILKQGACVCPACSLSMPRRFMNQPTLESGILLPDISFNQDILLLDSHIDFEEKVVADALCDALIVLSPTMHSQSAMRMLRMLCCQVHAAGGVVILVGMEAPPGARWDKYIDIHVEVNVDTWAAMVMDKFGYIQAWRAKATILERVEELRAKILKLERQTALIWQYRLPSRPYWEKRSADPIAVTGQSVSIKIEEQEYVWREPVPEKYTEKYLAAYREAHEERMLIEWGLIRPRKELPVNSEQAEPVVKTELKPLEFTEEESSQLLASEPASWINPRSKTRKLKCKARSGGSAHKAIEESTEPAVGAKDDENLISGVELFNVWVPENWERLIESLGESKM
ncbi:hypothetical protein FRC09_008141 [Ceratobasidium sp. 395]|nr:hypothetical protein FRC09_008141 [Ceratobasidium sp. 395]